MDSRVIPEDWLYSENVGYTKWWLTSICDIESLAGREMVVSGKE
jgi:hypothetical protein